MLELLCGEAWSALLGCNRQLRQLIQSTTQTAHIDSHNEFETLSMSHWPRLGLILLQEQRNSLSIKLRSNGTMQLLADFEPSLTQSATHISLALAVALQRMLLPGNKLTPGSAIVPAAAPLVSACFV